MNKIDRDNNVTRKFQPMSKRFIVWDKELQKFYEDSNGIVSSVGLYGLAEFLNICGRPLEQLEVIQSTNLFDKNGKEIFEGSIVENHFIGKNGCVYYDEDVAGWRILYKDGTWDDLYYVRSDIATVGHILSNLELLEEHK